MSFERMALKVIRKAVEAHACPGAVRLVKRSKRIGYGDLRLLRSLRLNDVGRPSRGCKSPLRSETRAELHRTKTYAPFFRLHIWYGRDAPARKLLHGPLDISRVPLNSLIVAGDCESLALTH
jgi:hypothetical protein